MKKILDNINLVFAVFAIFLFSLIYFYEVNKVSYAFEESIDLNKMNNKRKDIIKSAAVVYSENKIEEIKEKSIYIKVEDLVNSDLVATNNDGDVLDIVTHKSLMGTVIKLSYDNDKIIAEVNI